MRATRGHDEYAAHGQNPLTRDVSVRGWTIPASPDGPSLSTYTLLLPAARWRNVDEACLT